jgi:hypothetical protein
MRGFIMNHVVAVHVAPNGTKAEHIQEVMWVADNFVGGKCSVSTMVDFLRKNPGQLVVSSKDSKSVVEVVEATPPYIRSTKDASVSDNLLTITRY